MPDHLNTLGFARIPGVLDATELSRLLTALGPTNSAGRRGLLSNPTVAALASSTTLLDLVRPHLPTPPVPTRAIYFDKSPDTNWLVPWHQDLTIALRERADIPGFGPWSTKDRITHVQPPVALLEQMLTVRLHLDPTDASNGALRVLPGSHRSGRLDPGQIQQWRERQAEFLCTASAGDVLLMRPLLLHASARSTTDRHRRILHIEYAGFTLPDGLHWHDHA
jgi:hypothetical protein